MRHPKEGAPYAATRKVTVPIDVYKRQPKDHPFVQIELMMPILPLVRVPNVDEAIDFAVEVEHGNRHTAMMHSKNVRCV